MQLTTEEILTLHRSNFEVSHLPQPLHVLHLKVRQFNGLGSRKDEQIICSSTLNSSHTVIFLTCTSGHVSPLHEILRCFLHIAEERTSKYSGKVSNTQCSVSVLLNLTAPSPRPHPETFTPSGVLLGHTTLLFFLPLGLLRTSGFALTSKYIVSH